MEEEEREAEGQIEGEVKRKVKGIERLRLEQVPLSGDGLPRCHDQTRVCTASTVLAEEQPGKLNFGWDGRRRKSGEEELYEGVGESTQVSSKEGRDQGRWRSETSVSSRFTHLTGAKSAKTRGACYRARLNEFGPGIPSVNREGRGKERIRFSMESAAIYFYRLFVG